MIKKIYLAGGCFWGVEKFFSLLPGVTATEAGYANGATENPTYLQVCRENTGHAETVAVEYDPDIVSLSFLLECYFQAIDPLSVNRQGNDAGTQYRTGIYYTDNGSVIRGARELSVQNADKPVEHYTDDESVIRESIRRLECLLGRKAAIEVAPLSHFYPAEETHQQYLFKNPGGYCHIRPELFEWAKAARENKKDKSV